VVIDHSTVMFGRSTAMLGRSTATPYFMVNIIQKAKGISYKYNYIITYLFILQYSVSILTHISYIIFINYS